MWYVNRKVKEFFRFLICKIRCQNVDKWINTEIFLNKFKITEFKGIYSLFDGVWLLYFSNELLIAKELCPLGPEFCNTTVLASEFLVDSCAG